MTSYHGGKQRIGKSLADCMNMYIKKIGFQIGGYCEPFCGMLGVYNHATNLFGEKITYKAGDLNRSVISMWKSAQKGWVPPTKRLPKDEYMALKLSPPSALKGFVGHSHSFRALFFGSYFTHPDSKILHNSRRVHEMAQKMKKVRFRAGDYNQYTNLAGYAIYCDPPYQDTQQRYYKNEGRENVGFVSSEFWDWCRQMSNDNVVFVSEYSAPKDFKKIWEKGNERLYVIHA